MKRLLLLLSALLVIAGQHLALKADRWDGIGKPAQLHVRREARRVRVARRLHGLRGRNRLGDGQRLDGRGSGRNGSRFGGRRHWLRPRNRLPGENGQRWRLNGKRWRPNRRRRGPKSRRRHIRPLPRRSLRRHPHAGKRRWPGKRSGNRQRLSKWRQRRRLGRNRRLFLSDARRHQARRPQKCREKSQQRIAGHHLRWLLSRLPLPHRREPSIGHALARARPLERRHHGQRQARRQVPEQLLDFVQVVGRDIHCKHHRGM